VQTRFLVEFFLKNNIELYFLRIGKIYQQESHMRIYTLDEWKTHHDTMTDNDELFSQVKWMSIQETTFPVSTHKINEIAQAHDLELILVLADACLFTSVENKPLVKENYLWYPCHSYPVNDGDRTALKLFSNIISLSPSVKLHLQNIFPQKNIFYIPHFTEKEEVLRRPQEIKIQRGIPLDKKIILVVASFYEVLNRKGIDYQLIGIDQAKKKRGDIFVFIQSAYHFQGNHLIKEKVPVEKLLKTLGWISGVDYIWNQTALTRLEIAELYTMADILCSCSKVEGFGLPIVEAQNYSCAVLTTDFLSMKEHNFQDLVCPVATSEINYFQNGEWVVPSTSGLTDLIVKTLESPPDPQRANWMVQKLTGWKTVSTLLKKVLLDVECVEGVEGVEGVKGVNDKSIFITDCLVDFFSIYSVHSTMFFRMKECKELIFIQSESKPHAMNYLKERETQTYHQLKLLQIDSCKILSSHHLQIYLDHLESTNNIFWFCKSQNIVKGVHKHYHTVFLRERESQNEFPTGWQVYPFTPLIESFSVFGNESQPRSQHPLQEILKIFIQVDLDSFLKLDKIILALREFQRAHVLLYFPAKFLITLEKNSQLYNPETKIYSYENATFTLSEQQIENFSTLETLDFEFIMYPDQINYIKNMTNKTPFRYESKFGYVPTNELLKWISVSDIFIPCVSNFSTLSVAAQKLGVWVLFLTDTPLNQYYCIHGKVLTSHDKCFNFNRGVVEMVVQSLAIKENLETFSAERKNPRFMYTKEIAAIIF